MPILKNVLGLDLGSHTLKAVELQQGLRTLEAVRLHAEPRRADLPLAEQLQQMLATHSFTTDHVVTAVRGDRVSLRRLDFPFSEKRRIAQAVPFEIEDQVPFEIDDMVLAWELAQRERNRAQVLAALAPREEVSGLIETLAAAGCDPRTIEAEGLALSNLVAAFELPETGVLIDVGHTKTTFCALHEGVGIAARTAGIGGRAFTEALAQERSLSLEDAERTKHEQGVMEPGVETPFPRADAVIARLASEITGFVTSLEPLVPGGIDALVLLGGGARLEHLDTWLHERTGLPTRRLGLPREEAGLGLVAGGEPLGFAPTVALALRGTTQTVTHINLRQDDFARRADFSRVRREFGTTGILAAVVAGLALVSFSTGAVLESREAGRVEEQIAALYSEAFPGQPIPENPIGALRDAVRDANERAEFLGVYRGNLSALDVLTEISSRVPAELEVGFEELSIDKQTVRIRVYAKSFEAADRIGAELSKFGPFEQARIGAIETDKRTGGKKFNVTISLAGEDEE